MAKWQFGEDVGSLAINNLCIDGQPRIGISLFCIDTGGKANLNKLNQFGTE